MGYCEERFDKCHYVPEMFVSFLCPAVSRMKTRNLKTHTAVLSVDFILLW